MYGVYKILNKINNKIYIGSTTKSFDWRFNIHKKHLIANKHFNQHLQRAWNKYGEFAFSFEILEVCNDRSNCIVREQFYFDKLKPEYNILKNAGSVLGYRHSVYTKSLIGKFTSGKSFTGNHIFYNPSHGIYVGSVPNFTKKFKLARMNGYNLIHRDVEFSHGWIYIGKSKHLLHKNMHKIYMNKLKKRTKIYTLKHNTYGIFVGSIPDLLKKYNLDWKSTAASLYEVVNKIRNSAKGWTLIN